MRAHTSLVSLLLVVITTCRVSDGVFTRNKRQNDDFECPSHDGLFADPATCRRFYICSGNYPFSQTCPPSLFFDDVKKFCTRKTKDLVCGPSDITTVPPTPDPLSASKCDLSTCKLPDCFCSSDGTRIPGNIEPGETPQMVLLTFDGAINTLNYEHYRKLLNESRQNPNGCPIKATFFTSHAYSSYFHIQQMYAAGHEIAAHSISNRGPEERWETTPYQEWAEEMVGMREILHKFANISRDSVLGMRAPFLKPGGNEMMSMIYDYGFAYDSSLSAPQSLTPIWPYTLDHKVPHRCVVGRCPTQAFPGIWEIPLNTLHTVEIEGGPCVLADQCVFPEDEPTVFGFLMENFQRHYQSNRAPFGLFFHINWFNEKSKIKALHRFVDTVIANHRDVWFVTMQQALLWMRDPVPSSNLATNYVPWACEKRTRACNLPNTCALPFYDGSISDLRYMQTCTQCPEKYPWVGNFEGTAKGRKIVDLSKDDQEEE